MTKKMNVRNATAAGVTVGAVAAPAIAYGAAILETKTGIPQMVTMPLLGSLAGFFMRWAAKLNPTD